MNTFVSRLRQNPRVLGIVLLGGLGKRSFIDKHSDLDISVIVEETETRLHPPFSFNTSTGSNSFEFNVTTETFSSHKLPWSTEKRAAYRNGTIVWDPTGSIKTLINKNLSEQTFNHKDALVTSINQSYWSIMHSRASIWRNSPLAAHALLNHASTLLAKGHLHLNKRDIPHLKWLPLAIQSIEHKIPNFEERLLAVMQVSTVNKSEAWRRSILIFNMTQELHRLAQQVTPAFPSDVYTYWARNISTRQASKDNLVDIIVEQVAKAEKEKTLSELRTALAWVMAKGLDNPDHIIKQLKKDGIFKPTNTEIFNIIQNILVEELKKTNAKS